MSEQHKSDFLSLGQTCTVLDISLSTLKNWLKTGKITEKNIKMGRFLRGLPTGNAPFTFFAYIFTKKHTKKPCKIADLLEK